MNVFSMRNKFHVYNIHSQVRIKDRKVYSTFHPTEVLWDGLRVKSFPYHTPSTCLVSCPGHPVSSHSLRFLFGLMFRVLYFVLPQRSDFRLGRPLSYTPMDYFSAPWLQPVTLVILRHDLLISTPCSRPPYAYTSAPTPIAP